MNPALGPYIKQSYAKSDLVALKALLDENGTLEFARLSNGLFPAAAVQSETAYTGYASIWLRDNTHIANVHDLVGKTEIAVQAVQTLLSYMKKQSFRFERMIRGETKPDSIMDRPHVRFDGNTLDDIDQTWAHAQNDALGYFLWLYFKLARRGAITPTPADLKVLALFPLYFEAIRYWQDEDSGHWEETRKVSASSMGIVVAGLRQMKHFWASAVTANSYAFNGRAVTVQLLDALIDKGMSELAKILPSECIQQDPKKARAYDGALLFLIYPAEVVDEAAADQILERVLTHLKGDFGVRRYIGDSFWSPNYKKTLSEDSRTADFSSDLSQRDALLPKGQEAQWCIFDPIISTIYGRRYVATRKPEYLELQTTYFNRSLEQITAATALLPAHRCPELYYVEDGQYVPGDATPLLWTQANLLTALHAMEQSVV